MKSVSFSFDTILKTNGWLATKFSIGINESIVIVKPVKIIENKIKCNYFFFLINVYYNAIFSVEWYNLRKSRISMNYVEWIFWALFCISSREYNFVLAFKEIIKTMISDKILRWTEWNSHYHHSYIIKYPITKILVFFFDYIGKYRKSIYRIQWL